MEELQRWGMALGGSLWKSDDGEWVRITDVQEREARFQARIEELEAGIRDVQNDLRQSRATLEDLRSLLDSGEEQICPDCGEVLRESVRTDGGWYCPGCERRVEEPACLGCRGLGQAVNSITSEPVLTCPSCDGSGQLVRESGPYPVAVPEKVEECPDWSDAEIRAAVAAFRATEEVSDG